MSIPVPIQFIPPPLLLLLNLNGEPVLSGSFREKAGLGTKAKDNQQGTVYSTGLLKMGWAMPQ